MNLLYWTNFVFWRWITGKVKSRKKLWEKIPSELSKEVKRTKRKTRNFQSIPQTVKKMFGWASPLRSANGYPNTARTVKRRQPLRSAESPRGMWCPELFRDSDRVKLFCFFSKTKINKTSAEKEKTSNFRPNFCYATKISLINHWAVNIS